MCCLCVCVREREKERGVQEALVVISGLNYTTEEQTGYSCLETDSAAVKL